MDPHAHGHPTAMLSQAQFQLEAESRTLSSFGCRPSLPKHSLAFSQASTTRTVASRRNDIAVGPFCPSRVQSKFDAVAGAVGPD
eukprot:10046721-Alexandrium_andersonii.AAC.1